MDDQIGIFEAKTQLSQLIERVASGESIVITRHGHPVARLVPYEVGVDRARVEAAVSRLLRFGEAEGVRLPDGVTIRDLLDEGRR